jgi:hypothetical protein
MLKGKRGDLSCIGPPLKPDDQIGFIKIWFLGINDLFHRKFIPRIQLFGEVISFSGAPPLPE